MNPYQDYEAISGTYGKVYEEGKWLAQFHSVKTDAEAKYADVPQAGNNTMGKKYMGEEYTGTAVCKHYETEFKKRLARSKDPNQKPFVTDWLVALEDPAAIGYEKVRLYGVKFTKWPIIGFEHGSLEDLEFEFTFRDYEYVEEIAAR
ncbi:phage tail tube protein [Pseudobacillus wudalianchiensis]|uniref:Phage portal protein n=1 Tax=Pseudobacillus wudalianchiensis TaxID=1743143 RepID=A0A1B9ATS7_9BACI|nr:phage tail tube protein [Bacillus wudalianchiensis]OCA87292.1 hypothetical protein A8F95_08575 [Bacillus wudalianchiensis]